MPQRQRPHAHPILHSPHILPCSLCALLARLVLLATPSVLLVYCRLCCGGGGTRTFPIRRRGRLVWSTYPPAHAQHSSSQTSVHMRASSLFSRFLTLLHACTCGMWRVV